MPDTVKLSTTIPMHIRHRGRGAQIRIYLGKFFRMFVFQNDWKVLPMSMVIAALVALVFHGTMYRNMENTLLGAFAVSCISIWNGCFNSIQVVCRERGIVKREHRSGMHISSYVAAHMIYQAFLCISQSALTTYVFYFLGVHFPEKGYITSWSMVDFGLAVFLVTYASDMMGLFVSSIVRSTTLAMTIVPFILIFQLIFSGGFFSLPSWCQPLTDLTISRYGIKSICALGGYNELPSVMPWNTLFRMRNTAIEQKLTVKQVREALKGDFFQERFREIKNEEGVGLDSIINILVDDPALQIYDNESYDLKCTIGELIDLIGEEKARNEILEASRQAGFKEDYDQNELNLFISGSMLVFFTLLFAGLSVVSLEFIDRDKR